ncbi:hypothetical protein DWW40_09895 [Ruminococcus bromii]|jgi:uncharacterized phage protein (TIGR01671 family)|nr:YopX family protein [Ruminococcus bromii]RGU82415.1 hypothetical protein DWW40_09895 [Ruminococcus bromii]
MMREILFRGKAINRDESYHRTEYQNGEWVYGLVTKLYDEQFKNLPAEMTNTNGISGIEIDYKTIGQYTGMLDKNGTKIFEGDIIDFFGRSDGDGYGVVKYDAYETEFGFEYDNIYRSLGKNFYPENIEVVGNIYDNPELLGDEENDKRKNR